MEGQYDRAGDDGEVHGKAQPGEKRPLVRAVVADFGDVVRQDEGAEEGFGEEDGVVYGIFAGVSMSVSSSC